MKETKEEGECPNCGYYGDDFEFKNGIITCPDCGKKFKNMFEGYNKPGTRMPGGLKQISCPVCKGRGHKGITTNKIDHPCERCKGSGKVWNSSILKRQTDYDVDEMSTVGGIGGFNGPMGKQKKIKESLDNQNWNSGYKIGYQDGKNGRPPKLPMPFEEVKSLTQLIKEAEEENPGHGIFQWKKQGPDLSGKSGSLANWIAQVSKNGELQKHFGKGYNPEEAFGWIEAEKKKSGLHISDKYLSKMHSNLSSIGNNPNKAMQYVYNAFLKGAGEGLSEAEPTFTVGEKVNAIIHNRQVPGTIVKVHSFDHYTVKLNTGEMRLPADKLSKLNEGRKNEFRVENKKGKWAVVDSKGKVMEDDFPNKVAATEACAEWNEGYNTNYGRNEAKMNEIQTPGTFTIQFSIKLDQPHHYEIDEWLKHFKESLGAALIPNSLKVTKK